MIEKASAVHSTSPGHPRDDKGYDAKLLREPPIVSVIIPTFNERDNVEVVSAAVYSALQTIPHEIVFVDDDSSDGTLDVLMSLTRRDASVRLIHRIGRRGLAGAVTEGMLSTSSPILAVIDADMQHDERILLKMIRIIQQGDADLVVGSRYAIGGSIEAWDGRRAFISAFATRLARLIMKSDCSDPMSGFFAISRNAFDNAVRQLSGQGYKILFDICASSNPPLRLREVPYQFRRRQTGESKLDSLVAWEYLMLLVDKLVGHILPARFLSFIFIGGVGVLVHMTALSAFFLAGIGNFTVAQGAATLIAMVFNFFVNNLLTYREVRLKGVGQIAKGLASFIAACSIGAFANVGVANYLFSSQDYVWWLAGLSGILVGAVWNYAATSVLTWRGR